MTGDASLASIAVSLVGAVQANRVDSRTFGHCRLQFISRQIGERHKVLGHANVRVTVTVVRAANTIDIVFGIADEELVALFALLADRIVSALCAYIESIGPDTVRMTVA